MLRETPVRRVIVVVLDGLRPDAIPRFRLPNLTALVQRSAYTMLGRTVTPSVTACAMASLLTGAAKRGVLRSGLVLEHWPDADRAGHADGWMSGPYAKAAWAMDATLGTLMQDVDLNDPQTLLIALADHGGGGAVETHHNSLHPLDTTIPLLIAGGAVRPGELAPGASLLDVPATVCYALGIARPESFTGRPLSSAFARRWLGAAA